MPKLLFVGDVHATANDLDDCKALIDFVIEKAKNHKDLDAVVFLGDIYDTHAIINAEVLKFWHDSFNQFNRLELQTITLCGNHDSSGSPHSKAHALIAHYADTTVVDKPIAIDGIGFMPYMHFKEEFVTAASSIGTDTIICHQSFNGAQFENGFPDPSGIDVGLLNQRLVIAGHLHLRQAFGVIRYLGSPRWRTKSDANIDKSIVYMDVQPNGTILEEIHYDTSLVCRKVHTFEDRPNAPVDLSQVKARDRVYIDIYGPEGHVNARKDELAATGYRIRTFKEETKANNVIKESDGISKAFSKWVQLYKPKYGTSTATLQKLLAERINL
jgi:DNA repair exonuclease SbcCD nuclease subunit